MEGVKEDLIRGILDGATPCLVLDYYYDTTMRTYISLRVRWVDPRTYEVKAKTLALKPLETCGSISTTTTTSTTTPDSHAVVVNHTLESYGINSSTCWYAVCDGSSGMDRLMTGNRALGVEKILGASVCFQRAVAEALEGG